MNLRQFCSHESMRTNIPEKLLAISDEIVARGHANLTRLTVLKPWFERPNRLRAFAICVAARAKSRKGRQPRASFSKKLELCSGVFKFIVFDYCITVAGKLLSTNPLEIAYRVSPATS